MTTVFSLDDIYNAHLLYHKKISHFFCVMSSVNKRGIKETFSSLLQFCFTQHRDMFLKYFINNDL